jgi:hypothetical protein
MPWSLFAFTWISVEMSIFDWKKQLIRIGRVQKECLKFETEKSQDPEVITNEKYPHLQFVNEMGTSSPTI